jgi:exopolyphosphatase/guanosine-5'-triphosphate,3'-diphosphate pyrophosphatase
MPGLMPRMKWKREVDGRLVLIIPASHRDLIGERPTGRLAQLAKLLGQPVGFAVDNA